MCVHSNARDGSGTGHTYLPLAFSQVKCGMRWQERIGRDLRPSRERDAYQTSPWTLTSTSTSIHTDNVSSSPAVDEENYIFNLFAAHSTDEEGWRCVLKNDRHPHRPGPDDTSNYTYLHRGIVNRFFACSLSRRRVDMQR